MRCKLRNGPLYACLLPRLDSQVHAAAIASTGLWSVFVLLRTENQFIASSEEVNTRQSQRANELHNYTVKA